jgi:hypothetical protein
MRINTKIVLEKVETRVEILNRKFRQGTIEKYYTILDKSVYGFCSIVLVVKANRDTSSND